MWIKPMLTKQKNWYNSNAALCQANYIFFTINWCKFQIFPFCTWAACFNVVGSPEQRTDMTAEWIIVDKLPLQQNQKHKQFHSTPNSQCFDLLETRQKKASFVGFNLCSRLREVQTGGAREATTTISQKHVSQQALGVHDIKAIYDLCTREKFMT